MMRVVKTLHHLHHRKQHLQIQYEKINNFLPFFLLSWEGVLVTPTLQPPTPNIFFNNFII
jgi:hypothetical protein